MTFSITLNQYTVEIWNEKTWFVIKLLQFKRLSKIPVDKALRYELYIHDSKKLWFGGPTIVGPSLDRKTFVFQKNPVRYSQAYLAYLCNPLIYVHGDYFFSYYFYLLFLFIIHLFTSYEL